MELPHLETRWDYRTRRESCLVNLYPHPAALSRVEMKGLTEVIKFDHQGIRSDFTLDIIELTRDGLQKAGTWIGLHDAVHEPGLYRKPIKQPPNLFYFLSPLSLDVWIYMATAYLGVSVLLFILARFSPYEWNSPGNCVDEPPVLENQFTLLNSLWFTIGFLMQQGSDIAPKKSMTATFILIAARSSSLKLPAGFFCILREPLGVHGNPPRCCLHLRIFYFRRHVSFRQEVDDGDIHFNRRPELLGCEVRQRFELLRRLLRPWRYLRPAPFSNTVLCVKRKKNINNPLEAR
ncbi:unnamed protein product [Chilo suppressalis]|uniref:Ionotropic glutamate receptor C-terminal domain-containing protein n=1 Tax=Chilo suppressalis TaxID=168631 RepID=A0ABN8AXQ3_CHISP|nr:unnamed protein product [Chilo suppressalis]